jgi:Cof subfamily protein (haloacid dehalogenase superfamily)
MAALFLPCAFRYTDIMRQLNLNKIKALALDLDGTTLLPDGALGKRTITCLKMLLSKGIQVIFCTGRAVEAAEPYCSAAGVNGPMVFFNGAEITDIPSGKVLDASMLGLEAVTFGVDLARSMDVHYQIFLPPGVIPGAKEGREALLIDKPRAESEMYFKHTGITPIVRDLKSLIAMPGLQGCIKAMFITDPSLHDIIRQKMLERFGSSIYIARTTPTFLEIMSAGVSKARGLESVMRYRGLKPEEVIACGDEENDIPMFSAAGFAAAPSNAKEPVKAAADFIFGSNAEEGLAAYLEKLFANQQPRPEGRGMLFW